MYDSGLNILAYEQYLKKLEIKFNSSNPEMTDICNQCGKSYGEHSGDRCPQDLMDLNKTT